MKRWTDVLDSYDAKRLENLENALNDFIESNWEKFSYDEIYTALHKVIEIKMYDKEIEHDL